MMRRLIVTTILVTMTRRMMVRRMVRMRTRRMIVRTVTLKNLMSGGLPGIG